MQKKKAANIVCHIVQSNTLGNPTNIEAVCQILALILPITCFTVRQY